MNEPGDRDPYQIAEGMLVTLHFSLKLPDGEVIDSTFESSPATFSLGDGSLLPGFEQVLLGLSPKAQRSFVMQPKDGFGMPNPNNVHELAHADLPAGVEPEPGLMLAFADASGSELPGMIREVRDSVVVVDFNHPLAGHDIIFTVEIIDVRPASET